MPTFTVRSCPGGAFPAAAVVALLAGASSALAQCPPTFTATGPFSTGNPFTVTAGDFNHDGLMDFAAANANAGSNLVIRLANPNFVNDFQPPATAPYSVNARGLVAADFNHDGRMDLAAAYASGSPQVSSVAILISNPDGTFQAPVTYPVPNTPYSLKLADLNHDGRPDIVSMCNCGSASVLIANADGTFQPAVTVAPGVSATGLTVADINSDGAPDLVTTRYDDPPQVRVSLGIPGTGGTGYAAYVPYTVPGVFGPWGINTGDFNGDGRDDVVVTHRVTNRVGVLIGNLDGTLTPMPTAQPGVQPQDVVAADFNGDGKLDVVVGNWGGGNISVLLGDGAGGLNTRTNFTTGTHPNSVAVADMNGDGRPDILVANQDSGYVSVLLNTTPVTTFNPQPFPQRTCPGGGGSAQFSATATTTQTGGITSYRWQGLIGGVWTNLNDGLLAGVGTLAGTTTQFLTVAGVQGNAGDTVIQVRAVASTACGGNPSNAVPLSLIRQCGPADIGGTGGLPSPCGDGHLDNNDFIAFITYFFEGSTVADFGQTGGFSGGDGLLNNNDFVAFINAFFAGCPG